MRLGGGAPSTSLTQGIACARESLLGVSTGPTGPARIESAVGGTADEDRRKFGFGRRWSAFGGIAGVVGLTLTQPLIAEAVEKLGDWERF